MIKAIRFGAVPPNGKSINFIMLLSDYNEYFSWCLFTVACGKVAHQMAHLY